MVIRVIASGQSNMLGPGVGGPPFSLIDSRVRVWNNVNPLGANGTAFITPVMGSAPFVYANASNLSVWFCNRLAQIRGQDVNLTLVARSGTPIQEWITSDDSAAFMMDEMEDVWNATGQPPADIFLWHQGEGNANQTDAPHYTAYFLEMLSLAKARGMINEDTVVIVGGLAETGSAAKLNFNNSVLKPLAENNENIFYATSTGLTTYDAETHFTGESLYTFGAERYFAAYVESQGIKMADLFALVNEGGTPGTPGTGENKLYNLLNLALIGMEKKNTSLPADFMGVRNNNDPLTAAMLAAGSIVEYGTDVEKGSYVRFESGFQVCWNRISIVRSNTANLFASWSFPRAFASPPTVIPAFANINLVNMSAEKRGGSVAYSGDTSTASVVVGLNSGGLYTDGDEEAQINAFALGFWK